MRRLSKTRMIFTNSVLVIDTNLEKEGQGLKSLERWKMEIFTVMSSF